MDILNAISIVSVAAIIHASFQLSLSMLTLLSGHALTGKKSQARLLNLTFGFTCGVLFMTILLLAFATLVALTIFNGNAPLIVWAAISGLAIGMGVAVWAFYYRNHGSTSLWLPTGAARFLSSRIRKTTLGIESFSLGSFSVLAELLFLVAPLLIAGFVIATLDTVYILPSILLYSFISVLPQVVFTMKVNAGHKISDLQRWREKNKRFMQFSAGSLLIVLGMYVYVNEVASIVAWLRGESL